MHSPNAFTLAFHKLINVHLSGVSSPFHKSFDLVASPRWILAVGDGEVARGQDVSRITDYEDCKEFIEVLNTFYHAPKNGVQIARCFENMSISLHLLRSEMIEERKIAIEGVTVDIDRDYAVFYSTSTENTLGISGCGFICRKVDDAAM